MSEMSAEKKKEIEKYIIKSYFGGGKNVESLANGADVVKGTDDGCIPQLIVEVTYFGESGVVMINWNVYGDSQQNSFAMHICREREIERNRCDSVDSMRYAWEAWRAKIQGKPVFSKTNDEDLQKDKRIETFEEEIKALRAEKEVMERHIQELESHNVSLAETNAVLNNKLNEFDPLPEFRELLKKLYSTGDIEKLAWTLNHTCGGRGSVNGWIAVSLFWKQNYETLSKLVGFSSIEEIQDYLTNEANCDTLHEAISNLHDEVKHTSNEWNEMDKKLKDCEKENGIYSRALNEWKEATGCPSPSAAKTMIECMASWHHAYDDAKKEIESLKEALRKSNSTMQKELEQEITKWQDATGRIEPEGAKQYIERLKDRINKIHDCAVDW